MTDYTPLSSPNMGRDMIGLYDKTCESDIVALGKSEDYILRFSLSPDDIQRVIKGDYIVLEGYDVVFVLKAEQPE